MAAPSDARVTGAVVLSAAGAALGGLLFGFDTAVISGTTTALQTRFGLSDGMLGFTVASALIGTVLGSLVAGEMVIVLNDIHLDIADYLLDTSQLSDALFRTRWAEFEWENKVAVNTTITDPVQYLEKIIDSTSLTILGGNERGMKGLEGSCGYLAANLHCCSVFSEQALVNLSVEKKEDGQLTGYVRIRSKTQGIALSLGDKITLKQKSLAA